MRPSTKISLAPYYLYSCLKTLGVCVGIITVHLISAFAQYAANAPPALPAVSIGLISVTLFGFQFLIGNIQTLPSDYFNGKNVGVVAGMDGTAAVFGVLITTWMVPVLTQTSYNSFFILAAVLVPMAWLSLKYLVKRK